MQNWKKLFEPHILYRGEDYYEDGRVDDPVHDCGCCTATVHGTENYEVSIFRSGSTIESMTCTCPYAREGRNCKHMAALLYFIERDGLLPLKNRRPYQKTPAQLVCSMSENDVRSFLTELAQNDPGVFTEMTYRYGAFPAEGLRDMLMTEIDAEAKIYMNFYHMDEWEALSRYADSLVSLLLKRLPALQAQGGPRLVLEIAFFALNEYSSYAEDTSCDGNESMLIVMNEIGSRLEHAADSEQLETIFSFLEQCHAVPDLHWIVREAVDNMLEFFFDDPRFAARNLAMTDLDLQRTGDDEEPWVKEQLLKRKYLLLRMLPDRSTEFEQFTRENAKYLSVQEAEIQALTAEENLDKAISLLLELRNLHEEDSGLLRRYTDQLISLYTKKNDIPHLKKELLYHILTFPQGTLDLVHRLKALVPEDEWIRYRTQYLQKKYEPHRLDLMEQEALWEELMEAVSKTEFLQPLQYYAKSLQPRFPEQFIQVYVRILQCKVRTCSTRSAYQSLAQDLKQLSTYPGGLEVARMLAAQWISLYPRRSAMREELKKAGF